ncbi:hypothetical protein K440DRAFT_631655 [Wilcoxina mikolae CBS 423.85]|nr:hypothetical protein K440DRAFT_631655 [Wilcoxina mikolae CBS 423.85]
MDLHQLRVIYVNCAELSVERLKFNVPKSEEERGSYREATMKTLWQLVCGERFKTILSIVSKLEEEWGPYNEATIRPLQQLAKDAVELGRIETGVELLVRVIRCSTRCGDPGLKWAEEAKDLLDYTLKVIIIMAQTSWKVLRGRGPNNHETIHDSASLLEQAQSTKWTGVEVLGLSETHLEKSWQSLYQRLIERLQD